MKQKKGKPQTFKDFEHAAKMCKVEIVENANLVVFTQNKRKIDLTSNHFVTNVSFSIYIILGYDKISYKYLVVIQNSQQ